MTFKKFMLLTVIPALFFINAWCPGGDPNDDINLQVPYYNQDCYEWCGMACVQMWAEWDGNCVTQGEIAGYTGAGFDTATPWEVLVGVGHYTASEGYLATRPWDEQGAQGDLISATINGVIDNTPSIMPFYNGAHAVLIKGYKYHEDAFGRPIAEKVHYHDPDNNPNKTILAGTLRVLFDAAPLTYWVIVGLEDYVQYGIDGHDEFVLKGGIVYGLPSPYDPKDLMELPPIE